MGCGPTILFGGFSCRGPVALGLLDHKGALRLGRSSFRRGNSAPRVSESAASKASAAANVSKPPSKAQSSYKSHPYSSRYHSSNVWMWFFFAMYIAEDDEPDEEEFEGWMEDQDEMTSRPLSSSTLKRWRAVERTKRGERTNRG